MIRLAGLLLLLWMPPVLGQSYRWVDGEGRVHYTQVPPTGREYQRVGPAGPATPAPNQETLNQALEAGREQEAERRAAIEKAELDQAQRDERCRAAVESLAYLEARTARRLSRTDEQGNVARLTEEEFQQRRAEQQAAIRQNCD